MSRVVYKYRVDGFVNYYTVPAPAKPLFFALQGGTPYVWVEHPINSEEAVELIFVTVGTGHVIPEGAEHIGSLIDGAFVWHLYYKAES